MPRRTPPLRPPSSPRGAQPRNRFLLASLAVVLLVFLLTLPWQLRNWQEAAALREDASRQQARMQQLQSAHDALRQAQDALRAAPNDPNTRLAAAAELAKSRDIPSTAALLRTLEPAAMRSPDLADSVAGLYQQIGYIDRAVGLARQAQHLAPDSPQTLLRLAILDTEIGRQTEAHRLLLRAVSLAPGDAAPHIALALDAIQGSDLTDAAKELAIARRLRPSDWQIDSLIADNRSARGRSAEAISIIAEAQRLAPQEPKLYAQQAALLWKQASANGNRQNTAPAVEAARQCLSLDPDNASALFTLGLAYQASGNETGALQEWRKAYTIAPNSDGLRFRLGRLLIQQGSRSEGSRILAENDRVTREDSEWNRLVILAGTTPHDPAPHRQLARWCQSHHRLSRAIFEWQEVLTHLPHDAEAKQSAAALLQQRG